VNLATAVQRKAKHRRSRDLLWMLEDNPERRARWQLNERLNRSEARLARKIGKRKVTALIASFKAEAAPDQSLYDELYRQADPYAWIYRRSKSAGDQRQ